nr:YqgQ family protein [Aneurinibacillus tyrosinisolvens]
MRTVSDVQALLRRFGIVIYMGDRLSDYEMWEDELRELYQEKLIELGEFSAAMNVLKQARNAYLDI